jgi:hypothetical protein
MALLVLAYPELSKSDFEKIQNYRKDHDELHYRVIEPHFTFVFPVFDITQNDFIKEVEARAQNVAAFDFTIRCATVSKDAFSDYFHSFLVPDQGYSNVVKLHDKLYSEKFLRNLRLDIDYIPHIGIGNSKDKFFCKKMADEWNSSDFLIEGRISNLSIVNYENNVVSHLKRLDLPEL